MTPSKVKPLAVVFGCEGFELSSLERAFFAANNPLGFILFQRNCDHPDQVRALVADLRGAVGRDDAPILIDQEGGRVARLQPPHWPTFPTAMAYADLYRKTPEDGLEAAWLGGRLIAAELSALGITIDCAPVLDVPQTDADPIIGDRAFGVDAPGVAVLAKAFMDGLMQGGVAAVIKHIPGHGRASLDSHKGLPRVTALREDLQDIDFVPFRALHMAPWAMTAHVVYEAFDARNPATLSPAVIAEVIRKKIGFQGVLVSDDLSMKALDGPFEDRARASLKAGCDVVLHCNGNRQEMVQVAAGCSQMTRAAWSRYKLGELHRNGARRPFDSDDAVRQARHRLDTLLGSSPRKS